MSLAYMMPTNAELRVINVARNGGAENFSSLKPDENNPLHGASWTADRTIRGELLSSLILGSNPRWPRGPKGFEIRGARIVGPIDLQVANAGSLALVGCCVEDGIYLTDGTVRTVNLRGTHVSFIAADRLRASGNIFLDRGFTSKGRVSFVGAEIAGNLVCSSASFGMGTEDALDATNLRVRDALLNKGFHARGAVLFVGAQITGDLDCSGSRFEDVRGFALLITRATIGGSVLLSQKLREFFSKGGVHLAWAKIGANLACDGGLFESCGERDNGIAIVGDGAEISGSVFLREGFKALGEVRFVGARVGGDFDCSKAEFAGKARDSALTIARADVGQALIMQGMSTPPKGEVMLSYAHVGNLVDDSRSWPSPGKLVLDGFVYDALAGEPRSSSERLSWLKLQKVPPFRPQPYEQLTSAFRRMGYDREARKIAIAKERALRSQGDMSLPAKGWSLFLGATIGHGYRPLLVGLWITGFVLFGWLIFRQARQSDVLVPSKESVYANSRYQSTKGEVLPAGYPEFEPLVYSLDTLLPFIDLHQKSYWWLRPTNGHRPIYYLYESYFIFHVFAGWALTALVVAAISGLLKRD